MQELEVSGNAALPVAKIEVLPNAILQLGAQGQFAWEEFFAAQIRNKHTRLAYLHAVKTFLTCIEKQESQLARITPGMVGRYFDQLRLSIPSKKLHMSAIRGFFDVLVLRHICMLNPALSVRTGDIPCLKARSQKFQRSKQGNCLSPLILLPRVASAIKRSSQRSSLRQCDWERLPNC
jgi:hypothetical protein